MYKQNTKSTMLPVPELWGALDDPFMNDKPKMKKETSKPSIQNSTVVGDNQEDFVTGRVGSPLAKNTYDQHDIDLDELKAFLDEGYNKEPMRNGPFEMQKQQLHS